MQYAQKKFNVMMPGSKDDLAKRWEETFGKKEHVVAQPPAVIVPPPPKQTVSVSGIWLRTRDEQGGTMKWTIIELLAEVDGEFRLIQTHRVPCIDGMISHITEPLGIEKAPINKL